MVTHTFQERKTDCLEIVLGFDPTWDYVEHNTSPRWHYRGACPTGHDRRTHGFYISSDRGHWWCFGACGTNGNARDLYQLLYNRPMEDDRPRARPATPKPQKQAREPRPPQPRPAGATIETLAQSKGLNPDFCRNMLAWEDGVWRSKDDVGWFEIPCVIMPYPDEEGSNHQIRYRVDVDGPDKYRWKGGSQISLYGLWNLDFIRQAGYCIIVEGETDFASLFAKGFPVLAVPGTSTWRPEWKKVLDGVTTVYLWLEPRGGNERPDRASAAEGLLDKLKRAFPQLRVIDALDHAKDPNELAQKEGDRFTQTFEELLAQARPARADMDPNAQFRTWLITHDKELPGAKFGEVMKLYLNELQEKLYLQYEAAEEWEAMEKVGQCFVSYKKLVCATTEEAFARRYHCAQRGCSLCALWLLRNFFTKKPLDGDGNEKPSKEEILQEHCDEPSVYLVTLGTQRIGPFPQEKEADLRAIYKNLRKMLTRLSDNRGAGYRVARDHCYGLRCHLRGEFATFQIALLANHEGAAAVELLLEHFSRETGVVVDVEEIECHGHRHAIEAFTALMAVPILWDTLEDYQIWRAATKGSKLIQGKGLFYKITGGIGSKKKPTPAEVRARGHSCPCCGNCQPIEQPGYYPVKSTRTEVVTSPITGRQYLKFVSGGGG